MRISTWNINSIRLRISSVIEFIKDFNIDVICLQETKTENKYFPIKPFIEIGFSHFNYIGQKSYNGVAILSKIPFLKKDILNFCGLNDARHVSVEFDNKIIIHNFYVPAGGDIPDTKKNPKFKHKIKFLQEMGLYFKKNKRKKMLLVGDLNVAPSEFDVWSHSQLLKVVSYTPIEREKLANLVRQGNWVDAVRYKHDYDEKLFSWWSYRSKDWIKSNRGRRLDHIFSTKDLLKKIKSIEICKKMRKMHKPSDHVPIIVELDL